MQLNNVEYSKQQSVYELAQEPPRLDAREAALAVGVTCLSALVGALGVILFGASFPMHGPGGALNFAGMLAGSTCLLAWAFVLLFVWHHIEKWRADLRYERERREAVLEAHWNAQGTITTETISETTITADDPARLLLLLFSLWQRRNEHPKPWSVRSLEGPQYLSVDRNVFGTAQIHLGQVPTREHAQQIAARLEGARLLSGNGERSTRRLQPQTLEEFLNLTIPRVLR
jgi:hypothetical protein